MTPSNVQALQAAAEQLIVIIHPDTSEAARQVVDFRDALTAALADPDEDVDDGSDLMWIVKDTVDWESGFFVDWKDTESLVGAVDAIAAPWGVAVSWGHPDPDSDDFLDSHDVPALLEIAHASLASQGLTLWTWNTEGDCYAGWIARPADADALYEIAKALDVEFRPADQPF